MGASCCRLWSCPYWWWPRIIVVGVGGMSAGAAHTDEVCWGVGVDWSSEYSGMYAGADHCSVVGVPGCGPVDQ